MSNEVSGCLSAFDRPKGEDRGKRVQGKATTLARRRFQASFKKFNQSENSFSQNVSPKDSDRPLEKFSVSAVTVTPVNSC